jgi:hypothetical protein
MAITILSEPDNGEPVVRAYQPLIYRVQADLVGINPIKLKATVYIGGQNIAEFFVSHNYYDGLYYYFLVNIQAYIENYFNNSVVFTGYGNGNVNSFIPPDNVTTPAFLQRCDFQLELETQAADTVFGGYYGLGDNVISNIQNAINATMRDRDKANLSSEVTVLPTNWLTNYQNTNGQVVRLSRTNEHISLCYYSTGDTREGLRVRTYDVSGGLLQLGYINLGQSFQAVQRVRRLLVGVANINNTAGLYWVGTPVVIGSNVHRYTLEVIDNYTLPVNLQQEITKTATVIVNNDKCEGVKLWFLNAWGCDEWVEFESVEIDYEPTQTNYRANTDTFIRPNERGKTTLNSFAQRSVRLRKEYTENEAEFNQLQELVNSPVLFLTYPNNFLLNAVTIREGSIAYEQRNSINEINLLVDFANLDLSQTN